MTTRLRMERLTTRCSADGVAADISRLSRTFGAERTDRKADYMADPRLRAAYVAFFLPQYAAKIALLLEQLTADGLLALPDRPRVLDVGAGPLTGLLGAWVFRGALGPSVALDLASRTLELGRTILREVAGESADGVDLVTAPLQKRPLPRGPFDLVIVAHVLNEVGDPRRGLDVRVDLVKDLTGLLAPGGRVVVVEPGTRVHGRALMAVRDAAFHAGLPILSPCRGARQCPLLRTPGDWCHGDLAWEAPEMFRRLEKLAGLDKTVLKHSHLVVGKRGDSAPTTGARLVSGLMTDRAGIERRYACTHDLVTLVGKPRLPPPVSAPLRGGLLRDVPIDLVTSSPSRPPPSRGPRGAGDRSRRTPRR